jgi:hypothetical protein
MVKLVDPEEPTIRRRGQFEVAISGPNCDIKRMVKGRTARKVIQLVMADSRGTYSSGNIPEWLRRMLGL